MQMIGCRKEIHEINQIFTWSHMSRVIYFLKHLIKFYNYRLSICDLVQCAPKVLATALIKIYKQTPFNLTYRKFQRQIPEKCYCKVLMRLNQIWRRLIIWNSRSFSRKTHNSPPPLNFDPWRNCHRRFSILIEIKTAVQDAYN